MTSRRSYDKQFKERAVKLYLRGDKTQKAIAEDLGIDRSLLSCWCRSYSQKNAFPGHGNPQDQELHKLRRDLRNTIEERDILKKALAIFSMEN
ncbi:MAG: transposase [Candidatus Thiodiazotropha endolucinida]